MLSGCQENLTGPESRAMRLKELVEQWLKTHVGGYRKLAQEVNVSSGTIGNIIAGYPPKNTTALAKFAAYFKVDMASLIGGGQVKEAGRPYQQGPRPSPVADRLLDIAEELDQEEREALLTGPMEIRQHLINQMKIVEKAAAVEKKAMRRRKAAG